MAGWRINKDLWNKRKVLTAVCLYFDFRNSNSKLWFDPWFVIWNSRPVESNSLWKWRFSSSVTTPKAEKESCYCEKREWSKYTWNIYVATARREGTSVCVGFWCSFRVLAKRIEFALWVRRAEIKKITCVGTLYVQFDALLNTAV